MTVQSLKVVPNPAISKGYDITDYINAGHNADDLLAIADQTQAYVPQYSRDLNQEMLAGFTGQTYEERKLISAFDIVERNPQTIPLIKSFINQGECMIIHSAGGVGKSMISFNIAVQVAMKHPNPLFDMFKIIKSQMTSLFIQSENQPAAVNYRLRGIIGNDPNSWDVLKKLFFPVIRDDILTIGKNFEDPLFIYYCIDLIKKIQDQTNQKMGFLWVDPLISYIDGDENDSQRMRSCLDGLTEIAQQTGVTPIVLSHDNKKDGYRGSSASYDWARNVIALKRVFIGEDRIVDFINDGQPVKRIAQIPAIEIISEKSNNMKSFEKFTIVMDHNCRFKKVGDSIPPKIQERCLEVQQALKDIGGFAESNLILAKAISELTGRGITTCKKDISEAAGHGFIKVKKPEGGSTHAYCYALNE